MKKLLQKWWVAVLGVSVVGAGLAFGGPAVSAGPPLSHGAMSGNFAVGASTHSAFTVGSMRALSAVSASSPMNITTVVMAPGGTGGTYAVLVLDSTTSTTLCTQSGNSCTASTGTNVTVACSTLAGAIGTGDTLLLTVDTTSCTGTDPTLNANANW
jgi:hypothetical protein